MAYELYKEVKDRDSFFAEWDTEQLKEMTESLKDRIYRKYIVKCTVMQRDKFTCQNEECPKCNNVPECDNLTMHHIKFQKNNGKDSARNCVTLCFGSHKSFHRGKSDLSIWGHTYKLHKTEEVDWKQVKAEKRKFRKQIKQYHGKGLSWELINILLDFLWKDIDTEELDDATN